MTLFPQPGTLYPTVGSHYLWVAAIAFFTQDVVNVGGARKWAMNIINSIAHAWRFYLSVYVYREIKVGTL